MVRGSSRRVAFLRGINVGGAGLLKMEDLRSLATKLGFEDVATVGASGNLLYDSRMAARSDASKLTAALVERMGKGVVVVRDAAEMADLTGTDRFADADQRIPDKWRFVAFLAAASDAPLPELPGNGPLRIVGRTRAEVFYTMSTPSSVAINMARVLERALGTAVTVRNWNVVRDIAKRLSQR